MLRSKLCALALVCAIAIGGGCASTARQVGFDIELNACVDSSETRTEYNECKKLVKEKYHVAD